ncbi:rhamnan synthesis F family protein [Lonsdalea iberica]|uniref:Rhamnan synthesis protein F n=1 Tax=Lonsdalea iberica TaxID=1082703 RepID=A0A1X3RXV7_9GAMM|nr:rhamnan synthesis F family protein [Lonsdalea iberica]OSN06944.1 hypothetical protein AU511_05460 [Lonsdalea iberica]
MAYMILLFNRAKRFLSLFSIKLGLRFRSFLERRKYPSKCSIIYEREYLSEPVMLLALYEKGGLRNDVQCLLKFAKKLGIYTIGVNTRSMQWDPEYSELLDCYIERDNFGRDFGSYKVGFNHIYSKSIDERCNRFLMINDSVFFSEKHCLSFLKIMFESEIDVLGATENHEIRHHLGSFCISMSGNILRSDKLKKYWSNYKNSDIRPEVIARGEMGLSQCLRSIVSADDQFRAYYDTAYVSSIIEDRTDELLPLLDRLSCKSEHRGWRKFNWEDALNTSAFLKNSLLKPIGDDDFFFDVNDWKGLEGLIPNNKGDIDPERFLGEFEEKVKAHFLTCFNSGSQIHANNIFLHYIGMPIIKLDGLYRGMFNAEDVENIASQLVPSQKDEFRRMMYSRPFGGHVLFGWKNTAFFNGFI